MTRRDLSPRDLFERKYAGSARAIPCGLARDERFPGDGYLPEPKREELPPNSRIPEIRSLREKAEAARREAISCESTIAGIQNSCRHDWKDSIYDPKITPGGHDPGDPPGTMGVDWRGPHSWPETREDRWSRTCKLCGKTEYTTKTRVSARAGDFGS